MITVHINKHTRPRKGDEFAVVLMENGRQLSCVLPHTPYEAEARMVLAAFTAYLATSDGQDFCRAMIAELP